MRNYCPYPPKTDNMSLTPGCLGLTGHLSEFQNADLIRRISPTLILNNSAFGRRNLWNGTLTFTLCNLILREDKLVKANSNLLPRP